MKTLLPFLSFLILLISPVFGQGQWNTKNQNSHSASWIRENVVTNPISTSWIRNNLKKESPKLILTTENEEFLKSKIADDPLVGKYYDFLKKEADRICQLPLLERKLEGRRLLGVSRRAVRRMGILALVYRIERDDKYLDRLNDEIISVCNFSDWNPSHFLDVAEMSYAVAISLDWCGEWLPESTIEQAKKALRKHIAYSFEDADYNSWVSKDNNWNQVCHGGLSAAALILADEDPELAARVIKRTVDKLPLALASYSPDGAYPEGPTYWDYGTSYNLVTNSFFETALGTDFNLAQSPGFMDGATYRMVVIGPSGDGYNYADAGIGRLDLDTWGILSWFAHKTGNSMYLNKEKVLGLVEEAIREDKEPSRLAPAKLLWMARFEEKEDGNLPVYWKGEGHTPVAIFREETQENSGFFLGVKGGAASEHHGNMDVGSFIFELNGVRWAMEPGNQSYHELEETIGSDGLWDMGQNSPRWSLLTKGNQYHSTLTVNGARHNVHGFAPIKNFNAEGAPKEVTLDLDEVFYGQLYSVERTFKKMDQNTLRIEDEVKPADNTREISWAMMTRAEVSTVKNGAILTQDGRQLRLKILQPSNLNVSVTALSPPPLPYDKDMENLKRLEIRIPAYILEENEVNKIEVELKEE